MMCFLPFITLLLATPPIPTSTSVLMEFCSENLDTTTETQGIIVNEEASVSEVTASVSASEQGELRRSLRPQTKTQSKTTKSETQDLQKNTTKLHIKHNSKQRPKHSSGRRVVVKKRTRGNKAKIQNFNQIWILLLPTAPYLHLLPAPSYPATLLPLNTINSTSTSWL